MKRYFDFNDFNDPIKEYIEDRVFFPVEPYTKKSAQIYVKKTYTQIDDSIWPFGSSNDTTYLTVDNILYYTAKLDYIDFGVVSVALRVDFDYDIV